MIQIFFFNRDAGKYKREVEGDLNKYVIVIVT